MPFWFVLPVNPEPWAVGSVTAGRRDGKIRGAISPNPNLVAFQAAVREELDGVDLLPSGQYKLTFYFWRQQAQYLDAADRRRQRNQADATNMQKGLEDALQGVLFENDRDVRDIRSIIMGQGPDITPLIVIEISLNPFIEIDFPEPVIEKIHQAKMPQTKVKNQWPPPKS